MRWMHMHWQKRQYMTPWDENELDIFVTTLKKFWQLYSETLMGKEFISKDCHTLEV